MGAQSSPSVPDSQVLHIKLGYNLKFELFPNVIFDLKRCLAVNVAHIQDVRAVFQEKFM